MDFELYHEFLEVAKTLNQQGIIPLLSGSLGVEQVTGVDFYPDDIDILVPGDPRGFDEVSAEEMIQQWEAIAALMAKLGYRLEDLHEHKFIRDKVKIGFGVIETLPGFAGIPLAELPEKVDTGAHFYLPTQQQFLQLYQSSLEDSYRQDRNNHKDLGKITVLEEVLGKR